MTRRSAKAIREARRVDAAEVGRWLVADAAAGESDVRELVLGLVNEGLRPGQIAARLEVSLGAARETLEAVLLPRPRPGLVVVGLLARLGMCRWALLTEEGS